MGDDVAVEPLEAEESAAWDPDLEDYRENLDGALLERGERSDDGPAYEGGGFGGVFRSRMSEELQIRLEAVEAMEADEAARTERKRQKAAEAFQERAQQAAIAAALEAGQAFNPRMLRGEGIGHTVQEFVAQAHARMDLEDAHAEAQAAADYRRWQKEYYAGTVADMSAPTALQLEEGAQTKARTEFYLDRARQREMAVKEARRLAQKDSARGDREVLGRVAYAASTALRGEAGSQTEYRTEGDPTGFGFRIR